MCECSIAHCQRRCSHHLRDWGRSEGGTSYSLLKRRSGRRSGVWPVTSYQLRQSREITSQPIPATVRPYCPAKSSCAMLGSNVRGWLFYPPSLSARRVGRASEHAASRAHSLRRALLRKKSLVPDSRTRGRIRCCNSPWRRTRCSRTWLRLAGRPRLLGARCVFALPVASGRGGEEREAHDAVQAWWQHGSGSGEAAAWT